MYEQNQNPTQEKETTYLLPISIIIAGIIIAGAIVYATGRQAQQAAVPSGNQAAAQAPAGGEGSNPAAPAATAPKVSNRDVVLGDSKAKVTIITFGDYQCPFCARFADQIEKRLVNDYVKTGKAKLVFKNLQFLGPESVASAVAAECAKDQGKFWPFHDAIYAAELKDGQEHNGNLNKTLFVSFAKNLSMDVTAFSTCIDSKKYDSKIQADNEEASKSGVNSTPTTFINGQLVRGAGDYAQFQAAIEAALKV